MSLTVHVFLDLEIQIIVNQKSSICRRIYERKIVNVSFFLHQNVPIKRLNQMYDYYGSINILYFPMYPMSSEH